ncbi:hypothetical protein MRX96_019109 [Rhipicephalus microplus]
MSGVASHVLLAQQPALVNRRRRGWVSGPGYFRTASISGTLLPSREPLPRKGVPPASPTDVTRRVAAYYPICSAMQYLALDRETCKEHPAVCTARPLDSSTEARATASRLSRSTEKARAVTGTVRHEQSPLSGPSDLASLVRPLAPRRRQRAPIPRMRRMYRQKSVHTFFDSGESDTKAHRSESFPFPVSPDAADSLSTGPQPLGIRRSIFPGELCAPAVLGTASRSHPPARGLVQARRSACARVKKRWASPKQVCRLVPGEASSRGSGSKPT